MNRFLRFIGVSAAIAVGGCQADHAVGPVTPSDEGPGALELRITGPDSIVGALLLVVGGGPVDSITAPGLETMMLDIAADDYRVVVRGPLLTRVTARLWVPDRRQAGYSATVLQAVNQHYEQQATAAYQVQIQSR